MSGMLHRRVYLQSQVPRSSYDVVIIGGGGHGLATAYYLARRFGVRDVAVVERSYIGSGGTGRNTAVVRANYKTPATIKFFNASSELYAGLSGELHYNLLRTPRGLLWLAHSEHQLQTQLERALQNQLFGVDTVFMNPREVHEICPQLDMSGGGTMPVIGAAYHPPGSIVRHDAVAWAYAERGPAPGSAHPSRHYRHRRAPSRAGVASAWRRPPARSPPAPCCVRSAVT